MKGQGMKPFTLAARQHHGQDVSHGGKS
jgi:hypothetical protein